MTYDSLVNHGDYLSPHYLAEVLPKDLKAKDGLLTRWAAFEETERRRHADAVADAARQGLGPDSVPPRVRTPARACAPCTAPTSRAAPRSPRTRRRSPRPTRSHPRGGGSATPRATSTPCVPSATPMPTSRP